MDWIENKIKEHIKVKYYNENQILLMNQIVKNIAIYIIIQHEWNGGSLS